MMETKVKLSKHNYRGFDNRHGHDNHKPSYWALGYDTLNDMKKQVSPDVFAEYCKVHFNCCGVPKI